MIIIEFLKKLLDSDFMPHGHCYFWKPEIVWTNAISDSIIAIAYLTIPLTLGYIVKVRKDFQFYWLLILFAVFILGCGATHIMDVINIWSPIYRLDSTFRAITAIASIGTAIALIKIAPKILLIPNPQVFLEINEKLNTQLSVLQQTEEELKAAEEELVVANEDLELKVELRTRELLIANDKLQSQTRELIESETRSKNNEHLFKTLADNIPNLAWMADPDGHIFWYNSQWYNFTGKTAEEMKGWGWKSVHHPNHIDEVMSKWTSSLLSGMPFEMIFPLKNVDGVFKDFLTRVTPITDEHGKVEKWLGTNTDVSEIKKTEEKLERQNIELTKINQDLDSFIYTASHDLKAPVSNIEALIDSLESILPMKDYTEDVVGHFSMIKTSINRFQKTIIELTEISKTQRMVEDELESIYFSEIFNEVCDSIAKMIEESNAVIITNLNENDGISFSKKNMRSIFLNLLTNSIKYRDPFRPVKIYVETIKNENFIILSVQDNGLGMEQEKKEQIFKMFKRLHSHVEGSGVGMYIVKRIVDNANGKIEVETGLGEGTLIRIFFPRN